MTNEHAFYFTIAAIATLWLLSKKITWYIILVPSFIASAFATLASIIHFQILAAMGFMLLGFLIVTLIGFIDNIGD